MQYYRIPYEQLKNFCAGVFQGYGFSAEQSAQITDVLLAADLSGIESHGIQRLIRYHHEILSGFVDRSAKPEIVTRKSCVKGTPLPRQPMMMP